MAKHKIHNHPKMEHDLASELGGFKYIVDTEFKDLFHWHKPVPGNDTHIIVKMCEYFEQTMPASDLGGVVRTGTKVRITKCPAHPEYVGKEGFIREWLAFNTDEEQTVYVIDSDGDTLEGYADRECFEVVCETDYKF